jgi:hypothetical protein
LTGFPSSSVPCLNDFDTSCFAISNNKITISGGGDSIQMSPQFVNRNGVWWLNPKKLEVFPLNEVGTEDVTDWINFNLNIVTDTPQQKDYQIEASYGFDNGCMLNVKYQFSLTVCKLDPWEVFDWTFVLVFDRGWRWQNSEHDIIGINFINNMLSLYPIDPDVYEMDYTNNLNFKVICAGLTLEKPEY